jgi:hypothetical protein
MGGVLSGRSTFTGCRDHPHCGQPAIAHQRQQQNGDVEQDVHVVRCVSLNLGRR